MARIILIIESKENRQLLHAFLSAYHSVGEHQAGEALEEAFKIGYASTYPQAAAVLERVLEIKARGRYL